VRSTHVGMSVNSEVFEVVADALAQRAEGERNAPRSRAPRRRLVAA